jgi:hypothetical protein
MSNPQAEARQRKMVEAQRELEDESGRIRMGKEREWALLEIAQLLYGINHQLGQANIGGAKTATAGAGVGNRSTER